MLRRRQEAAKGSSAQHLLQLEVVQLRQQLDEEERERRSAQARRRRPHHHPHHHPRRRRRAATTTSTSASTTPQEEAASHRAALQSLVDAAQQDTRSSLQALDADVGTLRTHAEKQLSAQAAGIEQAKARLLQCAQAIEKQWSTSKVPATAAAAARATPMTLAAPRLVTRAARPPLQVQQQRLESLSSSSSLHNQQLQVRAAPAFGISPRPRASPRGAGTPPPGRHACPASDPPHMPSARGQERMEALNKQQSRWRTALEDAVKTATADVQLLQAQCRALESAVVSGKADTRRMLSEQEAETQRQCDTLGRAIHSLAVRRPRQPPPCPMAPTPTPVGADACAAGGVLARTHSTSPHP